MNTFERITKIIAGSDSETVERLAAVYGAVVDAGVHRAPSIEVAEAAKVVENTQRDINIAFLNECALIFDRMGIQTRDVLAAMATKWNALVFRPGLVGGHCIGVDPYYLTSRAEELGFHPNLMLAARRLNDSMGRFLAGRLVKLLVAANVREIKHARVGVMGIAFKENVKDLRNSRVPEMIAELKDYGIEPLVHDPIVDPQEVSAELGLTLTPFEEFCSLDALVLAVTHMPFRQYSPKTLAQCLRSGGVLMDVKSIVDPASLPDDVSYWCL